MARRRIRTAIAAGFETLGYSVRRTRAPGWGDDAYLDQQRWLKDAPVRVVFDVGANVGDTVQRYRALFPEATIYAFEPFADVHAQLAARFAADARVRPQRAAVTDASGVRTLHVNESHPTNSLLPLNRQGTHAAMASPHQLERSIEVPAITLDAFCAREGIATIDLLKMDIQGGEGMALAGAAALLSRRAIRLLYLEVLFARLYEGQAYFCDLTRILERHGYHAGGLYNLVIDEQGLHWGDAIFLPN